MSIYYNGNIALTHNCLFNFVVGNRGAGKTYWSKEWAIKDFIKTGAQFIYVRRYKEEFSKGKKDKFFDDIADKFPDYEFSVKGYINKEPCGQFMSLSTAKIEKSVPFPLVNKIIFDEFILDKGFYYYLSDEVVNFLELYETVARPGTREIDVRVFFLSNAITITNPYFLYWKITPNLNSKFTKPRTDMLVEMVQNPEFIEMKKTTRFGQLVNGTKYGDYAIENKFLRDNNTFIGKKTGKARHYFTMIYNGVSYGIWEDYSVGKYFVSKDIDPSCRLIFSVTLEDHTPNTMLLKSGMGRILKTFIEHYKLGNVYYENINIKNVIYEIVRLSLM